MPEPTPHRDRRAALIVVLAVLLVIATATVVAIAVLGGGEKPRPAPSTPPSPGPVTTGALSSVEPTTASVTPSPSPSAVVPFGYQPLWPFARPAEVRAWQNAYRAGGHEPWHLDADATALAFTTGYLRFTGIDVVVSRSVQGTEALVAVGYPVENHAPGTAAVLHLARHGTGADAPWEVVGTKDTTLTITDPRYGTPVSSPVPVGGRITGVDENIRVQVRQPSSEQPLGLLLGKPALATDHRSRQAVPARALIVAVTRRRTCPTRAEGPRQRDALPALPGPGQQYLATGGFAQ